MSRERRASAPILPSSKDYKKWKQLSWNKAYSKCKVSIKNHNPKTSLKNQYW